MEEDYVVGERYRLVSLDEDDAYQGMNLEGQEVTFVGRSSEVQFTEPGQLTGIALRDHQEGDKLLLAIGFVLEPILAEPAPAPGEYDSPVFTALVGLPAVRRMDGPTDWDMPGFAKWLVENDYQFCTPDEKRQLSEALINIAARLSIQNASYQDVFTKLIAAKAASARPITHEVAF